MRSTTRAEQRAALQREQQAQDRDGVLLDKPASPWKAGIIGAVIAVAVVGVGIGVALALGVFS